MTLYGRRGAQMEDDMTDICVHLADRGGVLDDEPGMLLRHLTEEMYGIEIGTYVNDCPMYFRIAAAVQMLELLGMIQIERVGAQESHRGNKINRITLVI